VIETLSAFVARIKRQIWSDLRSGAAPSIGTFEEVTWKALRDRGNAQIGTANFHPDRVEFEFLYPDPEQGPGILTVTVPAPERIVFLPVPEWVIETIWQGEVSGSPHFESDAVRLVEAFRQSLGPETNAKHFGPQLAKRRE